MTGIPCGNPKRYKSRAVIRMTRDDKIPYEDQQIGIPGTGTETEAEKEFKKLLDQQMNISVSAAEKKVNFVASAREVMGTASGYMTLDKFLKHTEVDKKTNELKSLGFTNMQIGVVLQQEGTDIPTKKRKVPDSTPMTYAKGTMPASYHNDDDAQDGETSTPSSIVPHPDFVAQSIVEMRELQGKRDAELFAAANSGPQMSRHTLQLEAALLQGKTHLPLAHMYVNGARKYAQHLDGTKESGASVNDVLDSDPNSPQTVPKTPPKDGKSNAEEKKVITGKIESIATSDIEGGRLSNEEIVKQFPNYAVGTPYKVLYVKNLDSTITAPDLVSIFIRFQEEGKDKISFKLMDGKMKGQAFITFHDEPTATKALKLTHGFVFKNKPMIIQYGKQK